jgi:Dynamin family
VTEARPPAAGRTAPSRGALAREVEEATNTALTLLRSVAAGSAELAEAADVAEVERVRDERPLRPTVVVVGEAKRGKSSLVNALLNVPGLSPVDPQVATSAYLVIQRGEQPAARALVPGSAQPVPIPVDRLRDWATLLGDLPADQPPPRMIEVDHPSPLLANLTLVDTPGVGGLDAAHREIALAAVLRATALLFVADASAPFTAPELDFLAAASESVDLVIFAVSKTDAHRGWREVVEADRELLRAHAPRFADADLVPVSSRLFEQARTLPPGDLAATLRTESQVIALQMLLQTRVAAKAAALHEANVLRAARSRLDTVERRLRADLAACDPDPQRAEQLREKRERLSQSRRQDGRTWQLRLRADISRARLDTMHDLQREIREQSTYWRASIDRADREALSRLPQELDAVVHALTLRLFDRMLDRLRRVTDSALRDLFSPDELADVYAGFARSPALTGPVAPPDRRAPTAEDRLMLVGGVTGGFAMERLIALVPAMLGVAVPSLLLAPLSLGLGVLAGGWMVRLRRQAADKNHYKAWVNEALGEARAVLENEVAGQFVDAEQSLTLALDQAIARRVEQLDREIRQIDEALRMDAQERERRRKEIAASLALTGKSIDRLDGLLPRLRSEATQAASAAALARIASAAGVPPVGRPPGQPGPVPGTATGGAR